jgi:hypothetical protein
LDGTSRAGIVPFERLQNHIASWHRGLYDQIVGTQRRAFVDFLRRHPDVFVIFDRPYRVRLRWQHAWREADGRKDADRALADHRVVDAARRFVCVCAYQRIVTLDDFLASPFAPTELRRGDTVRVLRRHPATIRFDRNTFELSLPEHSG